MDNYKVNTLTNRPPPEGKEVIRVEDALIEEIYIDNRNGYVTISYGFIDHISHVYINLVKLIVNQATVILDEYGNNLDIQYLRKGMRIDAAFSSAMTRSIPPQSIAFTITVRTERAGIFVKLDRVAEVDLENNFLYTGDPHDRSDQIRFVITDATLLLNKSGDSIALSQIRPGQLVRIEHAAFQTASIPPQTTAFRIQLL